MQTILWKKHVLYILAATHVQPPGDPDLEDEISGFEWNQNVRIVLAILVVFISALVVWWIVS